MAKDKPKNQEEMFGTSSSDEENSPAIVPLTKKANEPDLAASQIVNSNKDEPFERLLINELFLPIHGFVYFTDEEIEVIDHPALQRLGQIYQLGQTHYVYRGATHKRLEHVLGTVHVTGQVVAHLEKNFHSFKKKKHPSSRSSWEFSDPLSHSEIAFTRLAALLHDIGHLPAGHTLEDEVCLFDDKRKHDNLERLQYIGSKIEWFKLDDFISLKEVIDKSYRKFLPANSSFEAFDLAISLILKDDESPLNQQDLGRDIRLQVCRDIVGNTICADLLDYLHRDWHHIGKTLTREDRLMQYMRISRKTPSPGNDEISDRFVIWVGEGDEIKTDAFSAILDHLENRYKLSEAVLFHRTKCMSSAMLERGLSETYEEVLSSNSTSKRSSIQKELIRILLDHSDESALAYFQEKSSNDRDVAKLFGLLRCRKVFKGIFSHRLKQRGVEVDHRIKNIYAPGTNDSETALRAKNRLDALRSIEHEFGIPRCSLAMYCPSARMNAKIAKVQIQIGDQINPLNKLDGADEGIESRLRSQLKRFESLWRVQVGIEREQYHKLSKKKMYYLRLAIKRLVFGIGGQDQIDWDSREIAKFLTQDESSPYMNKLLLPEDESLPIAARGSSNQLSDDYYPSDVPKIKGYIRND